MQRPNAPEVSAADEDMTLLTQAERRKQVCPPHCALTSIRLDAHYLCRFALLARKGSNQAANWSGKIGLATQELLTVESHCQVHCAPHTANCSSKVQHAHTLPGIGSTRKQGLVKEVPQRQHEGSPKEPVSSSAIFLEQHKEGQSKGACMLSPLLLRRLLPCW